MASPPLHATTLPTPLGPFLVVCDGAGGLVRTAFASTPEEVGVGGVAHRGSVVCHEAAEQVEAYFARRREAFDLPLAPRGTPFQRAVWAALRAIPFGTTESYGALATRLGRPGAARALGRANALNPLPVVVPCHRVVGAGGGLTGYLGGVRLKAALLAHEGARPTLFDAVGL